MGIRPGRQSALKRTSVGTLNATTSNKTGLEEIMAVIK
jgi:hypothetical protein